MFVTSATVYMLYVYKFAYMYVSLLTAQSPPFLNKEGHHNSEQQQLRQNCIHLNFTVHLFFVEMLHVNWKLC